MTSGSVRKHAPSGAYGLKPGCRAMDCSWPCENGVLCWQWSSVPCTVSRPLVLLVSCDDAHTLHGHSDSGATAGRILTVLLTHDCTKAHMRMTWLVKVTRQGCHGAYGHSPQQLLLCVCEACHQVDHAHDQEEADKEQEHVAHTVLGLHGTKLQQTQCRVRQSPALSRLRLEMHMSAVKH